MNSKKLIYCLCVFFLVILFYGTSWAAFKIEGLPQDPDWLVDEDIASKVAGWNKGMIKCDPPRGGYNEITEYQKVLRSWGYKARPMTEIKDLLPERHYEMYSHPEIWGTFRINETAFEPIKPRGRMWEKFMAQTELNKKEVYLDEKGWMRNYKYGVPFPAIDENDPRAADKLIWNYIKRYQDNDRYVRMDLTTKDRKGHERHNLILNRRMQFSGRVRVDAHTPDGLYLPNPENLDFVYATPYIAPYNLRGTIPLYYRYNDPDRDDAMWIYIPSIRRIRRMSTNQHQDRFPGGLDWTYDSTEGFEGHVVRFNWYYLGRKELLMPSSSHSHTYYNPNGHCNGIDQYYQKRNCYIIKGTYKKPINMTDLVLYLDPLLFSACYSVDRDMKGRDWIVQLICQGRGKNWFYTMYNDSSIDILRKHSTRALFAYSGAEDFVTNDLTMDTLKKDFLSR